jgi:hypothetical protein
MSRVCGKLILARMSIEREVMKQSAGKALRLQRRAGDDKANYT